MMREEIYMTFPHYKSPLPGIESLRPLGSYTFEGICPIAVIEDADELQVDRYIGAEGSEKHLDASDLMWFIEGVPWFVWFWGASVDDQGDRYSAGGLDPFDDSITAYLDDGGSGKSSELKASGYLDERVILDRGAVLIFPEPAGRVTFPEALECDNVGCLSDGATSIGLEF